MAELLDLHDLYFTRPDPATLLPLSGDLAAEVRDRLGSLGYRSAPDDPAALDAALADWAGVANLEERMASGHIDPKVLEYLRHDG